MAIVRSPLFDGLWDKLGGLEFRRRRNKKIELAKKRVPSNPRTFKQKVVRLTYRQGLMQYHQLTDEEKAYYVQKYRKENLDAYRAFMKEYISQNLPAVIYEITIDNSANQNELTDFQVLLNINGDSQFFQDCQNNPYAFYFVNEELQAKIPFFREEWDTVNYYAKVWLKVPSIPAEGKVKLYMLINPNRTTDESNPEQVFEFFDDFEGDSLDLNKWIVDSTTGTYSVTVGNSILELNANAGSVRITSVASFNYPVIVECLVADMNTYDAKNDTRHRYISSHANQNPFGSDCGVFDNPNNPIVQLFWQGSFTGIKANLNTFQLSQEIFIQGESFRWIRPEWDVQGSTTLTSIKLQYGLGDYGQTNRCGHMKFDWIRVRKYIEPEPAVTYKKL